MASIATPQFYPRFRVPPPRRRGWRRREERRCDVIVFVLLLIRQIEGDVVTKSGYRSLIARQGVLSPKVVPPFLQYT